VLSLFRTFSSVLRTILIFRPVLLLLVVFLLGESFAVPSNGASSLLFLSRALIGANRILMLCPSSALSNNAAALLRVTVFPVPFIPLHSVFFDSPFVAIPAFSLSSRFLFPLHHLLIDSSLRERRQSRPWSLFSLPPLFLIFASPFLCFCLAFQEGDLSDAEHFRLLSSLPFPCVCPRGNARRGVKSRPRPGSPPPLLSLLPYAGFSISRSLCRIEVANMRAAPGLCSFSGWAVRQKSSCIARCPVPLFRCTLAILSSPTTHRSFIPFFPLQTVVIHLESDYKGYPISLCLILLFFSARFKSRIPLGRRTLPPLLSSSTCRIVCKPAPILSPDHK